MRNFGRRKTPPTGSGDLADPKAVSPGAGMPVVVMRSAAGAEPNDHGEYYLIEAVSAFAEKLTEYGHYSWSEIPAIAVQVHCLFDYLGQVENGGHSQFVANRSDPSPDDVGQPAGAPDPTAPPDIAKKLLHAAAALEACGARAHLEILQDLRQWLAENPRLAGAQTGFQGSHAAGLKMLDQRFYAMQKNDPVDPKLAEWLASRDEIKIVEDADYTQAIQRLISGNPLGEARLIAQSVAKIERQMASEHSGDDASQRFESAVAIDLLLRKAGCNPMLSGLSRAEPKPGEAPTTTCWIVMADFRMFVATGDGQSASLVSCDNSKDSWSAAGAELRNHRETARAWTV